MGMNVESNNCSFHLGSTAFSGIAMAASGAGAAAILGNPVGVVGGALGGLAGVLIGKPISLICDAVSGNSSCGKVVASVVSAVASFFAQAGATVGISALMGSTITFGSACTLTALTWGLALPAIIAVGCCFLCCGACASSSSAIATGR